METLNGLKAILAVLFYKNYLISSTKFCNAVVNKSSTQRNFLKLTQPKEFNGRENTLKQYSASIHFLLLIQFRVLLPQGERRVTLFGGRQFFTGLTQRHRRPFTLILTPTITASSTNHHATM